MKIYKKGAYIVIEDNNTINQYNSQFLQIEKYEVGLNAYNITYNGIAVANSVLLDDIVDNYGTAYTSDSFDAFRLSSTGVVNKSSSAYGSYSIATPSGPYNTLSPSILNYVLIPGNTFKVNDMPRIEAIFSSSASVIADCTVILYAATANDLSRDNFAVGVLTFPALSRLFVPLSRTLSIIDVNETTHLDATIDDVPNDMNLSTTAGFNTSPIDWTVDQYIVAAGLVGNVANSIESISLKVSL